MTHNFPDPSELFIPEAVWHGLKQNLTEPVRPSTKEIVDEMLSIIDGVQNEAELYDPDDEYTDEERFRDEEYIREQNEQNES